MNDLKDHVNYIFRKYKNNDEIMDFKEEILSNLESKKTDLMSHGMEEKTAILQAKKSINSIDNLIESNKYVYENAFKLECMQTVLLFVIIAWIATIPLIVFRGVSIINIILLLASVIIGISFWTNYSKKLENEKQEYINIESYMLLSKKAWIIWGIFIVISIFSISAVNFASNIWFSYPVNIIGPYDLGKILIKYYLPLLTILIPIAIGRFPKILLNNEVGEINEKKK